MPDTCGASLRPDFGFAVWGRLPRAVVVRSGCDTWSTLAPVSDGGTANGVEQTSPPISSLVMRVATAWATVAVYGLLAAPLSVFLSFMGVSEIWETAVFSFGAFIVSSVTYARLGGDPGKLIAGLRSRSAPSMAPIGFGQSLVRSGYLLVFGAIWVTGQYLGMGGALMTTLACMYLVANVVSMAVTDNTQTISEILAGSVTVDTDPD